MPKVPRSEERRFFKGLQKVFQRLIDEVKQGTGIINGVNQKTRQFLQSPEVTEYLNKLVGRMASNIRVNSARSWQEAALKGSRGQEIYKLVKTELDGPVGEAF